MVLSHPFRCPTQVVEGHPFDDAVGGLLEGKSWALITSRGWLARGAADRLARRGGEPEAILGGVLPNPKISAIVELAGALPAVDIVVALGGGSVIDAAKGAVALRALEGDRSALMAHLRENAALPDKMAPTPLIAVPTTSGTGSEVTRWGTLWGDDEVKHSINDARLYPAHAILDPALCTSMSAELTLTTALDSLSHALEAIWNKHHTPMTDELAQRAIALIRQNLMATLGRPDNLDLRRRLQTAALLAGLAMGTTQTAIAHSISYPFTARLGLPHGIACSFTLAEVARQNMLVAGDRLALAADAFGCPLDGLPQALEGWLAELGVGAILERFVTTELIDQLSGGLMTRARAANNIRETDAEAARQIALNAYRSLCQDQLREPIAKLR
jgi:phosphonate metabolism-associated iron-containing alcohol dehydrogenase